MAGFTSTVDTLTHGAPVVRLYRTLFGRDPDPDELLGGASRLRDGAMPADLAATLLASPEGRDRYGSDLAVDAPFADAIADAATGGGALARAIAAAAIGVDRADLVASVADSTAARRRIPLLPGLVPGTAPDDALAYALWRRLYERPSRSDGRDGAPRTTPDPVRSGRPATQRPGGASPAHPAGAPAAHFTSAPPTRRFVLEATAGDTEIEAALRTIDSLRAQSFADWHLHLGARTLSAWPADAIAATARAEPRVTLHDRVPDRARLLVGADRRLRSGSDRDHDHGADEPSSLLWAALAVGDTLSPDALEAVADAFDRWPDTVVLFTDEDVGTGSERSQPRFRPAWSPYGLAHADARLAVVRADRVTRRAAAGDDASARDGGAVADAAARDAPPGTVRHLPRVLHHRAASARDEATAPPSRPRPAPSLPHPAPRVALLVPTRDQPVLLAACAAGVLERTDYDRLTLVVIDNGSTDPETRRLLDRLAADARVRVLPMPEPFNFARLNNRAAALVDDDVLVLLNDDVEVRHGSWLAEMVSLAVAPDIGAVGARLLYPDGTLQHAGMLLGPGATATHVGRHNRADDPGYLGRFAAVAELSAVTGACLAVRREVFTAVGGMDERLAVAWNDVDLCLRVRARGWRVLWTPHATLTHREGCTRGSEAADPGSLRRFREEQALMRAVWGDRLARDPFLNPNLLATEAGSLSLTAPRDEARPPTPG